MRRAFIVLLFICVLVRLILWLTYGPVAQPDTQSYLNMATQVKTNDFTGYNGSRAPVYPLVLLATGLDFKTTWLLQLVLGILISLMLFMMAFHQTKSHALALLVGFSYTLNLAQLLFEANILTETLSTFLIVLSLCLLMWAGTVSGRLMVPYCVFLALVTSLVVLTRPPLMFLPAAYLFYLVYQWSAANMPTVERVKYSVTFVVPVVVIVLAWSWFNQVQVGYFGPTTLTGYNLSNHSGAFIEYAPVEYAAIRDTYLKYREKRIAETGSQSMTIWDAFPEITERTGLSFVGLSKQLTRMSITLFVHHPVSYMKSVVYAWWHFWDPACYLDFDKIRVPSLSRLYDSILSVESMLMYALNGLFLIVAACSVGAALLRQRTHSAFDWLVLVIVLLASVTQALLEYGENNRYAVPFQPIIAYIVFVSVWRGRKLLRQMAKVGLG